MQRKFRHSFQSAQKLSRKDAQMRMYGKTSKRIGWIDYQLGKQAYTYTKGQAHKQA